MNPAPIPAFRAAVKPLPRGAAPQRNPLIAAVLALSLLFAGLVAQSAMAPGSQAAAPLTVAQAITNQTGSTATVAGYIVGQPTSATAVLRNGFTADTAVAVADSAAETNTAKMLYVQVTTEYRSRFGLRTTPSLMGKKVDVTGQLTAYFSHAGLKSPSSMALSVSLTPTPTPTAAPTPGGYYAPAAGKTGPALESSLHQIIANWQPDVTDQHRAAV